MYVHVRVMAGAKKESVVKESDDHFVISVREEAERNMANRRVIELIALHFHLPSNKVRIISGHQSPGKIVSVDGETEVEE